MRGLIYSVAVLAAFAVMITIGWLPVENDSVEQSAGSSSLNSSSSAVVVAEAGAVRLAVPDMMCEVACYPRVKESLESAPGVQRVELAEQKEEGVIDNRQVIVYHDAGFNVTATQELLAAGGYRSTLVP